MREPDCVELVVVLVTSASRHRSKQCLAQLSTISTLPLSSSRQLSLGHTSQARHASWRVLQCHWSSSSKADFAIGPCSDDHHPLYPWTEICTNFAVLGSVTDFFPLRLSTPSSTSFTSHVLTPFKMVSNWMWQSDWTAAFSIHNYTTGCFTSSCSRNRAAVSLFWDLWCPQRFLCDP